VVTYVNHGQHVLERHVRYAHEQGSVDVHHAVLVQVLVIEYETYQNGHHLKNTNDSVSIGRTSSLTTFARCRYVFSILPMIDNSYSIFRIRVRVAFSNSTIVSYFRVQIPSTSLTLHSTPFVEIRIKYCCIDMFGV